MNAEHITSHDEIITFCLADATDITDHPATIEKGDTVRFIDKRRHWIVTAVLAGNAFEVSGEWDAGYRRSFGVTGRVADRSRLVLVRKGNALDDAINHFLATGDYPTSR